jgi:flavin-dependent dehydrogenase
LSYDVVIVGASVSGNIAAYECAKRGLKVLVVERSDPAKGYRIKPCGGGLSQLAIEEFPQTRDFVIHKTWDLVNRYQDIKLITNDIPIYMTNRNELDLGLADMAMAEGAEYRFGEPWYHGSDYRSEWLIGAGGVTCPVAAGLSYKRDRVPIKVAYFDDPEWNEAEQAEFMFYDGFKGYGWIFPKVDFIDIGLGGIDSGRRVKELYRQYLASHGHTGKPIWEAGWQIPMTWHPDQRPIQGNTILCGDAANFVNPATGEGILLAMRSGRQAAMVITGDLEAADYPTFAPHLNRVQQMRDEIGDMGVGEFFDLGREDQKFFDEMVEFMFLEKPPPKIKQRSDDEKIAMYRSLLADSAQ